MAGRGEYSDYCSPWGNEPMPPPVGTNGKPRRFYIRPMVNTAGQPLFGAFITSSRMGNGHLCGSYIRYSSRKTVAAVMAFLTEYVGGPI